MALGRQGPFHVGEAVHVLDFGLRVQFSLAEMADRQVGVDPEASLLHVAITGAGVQQELFQRCEVGPRLGRRTQVRTTDDFRQRHARAIEIDGRLARNSVVKRFPGVFFEVEAGDGHRHPAAIGRVEPHLAAGGQRLVELGDLIPARAVSMRAAASSMLARLSLHSDATRASTSGKPGMPGRASGGK